MSPSAELRFLELNLGVRIILDIEDFERVKTLKWRVEMNRGRWLVIVATTQEYGKRKTWSLARFILNPPKGKIALLKVRPTEEKVFDFRRSNLFLGTRCDQNQTRPKLKKKTSVYRGVSFCSRRGNWLAQIKVNGTLIKLGYYQVEQDAARAYNEASAIYFGEHALLNNI